MEGTRTVELRDADFGEISVLFPIPRDDNPWGVLSVLQGTPWDPLILQVSGENMSHAMHGHLQPLLAQIGRPPKVLGRQIQVDTTCKSIGACLSADARICKASSAKLPLCYEAPFLEPEISRAASVVSLAWKDGIYVVVIDGPEFSLR